MDLFHGDNTPPFDGDEPRPGREDDDSVLVRTASKVNVRLKPIRHHLTPEGSSCLGSFVNGNLIARCVLPEQTAAQFLRLGILEEPVHLALLVREADPGLQGKLLALTPLPDDVNPGGGGRDEPAWKESVPSSNYEQEVAGGAGAAGQAESPDDEERLAAVFLGKIIRFDEDRKHPDNLAMEAADVLRSAVKGGAGDVVDRLLQDVSEDVEVEGQGMEVAEDPDEPGDPGSSGGEGAASGADGGSLPSDDELFPDDLEAPGEPGDADGPEASGEGDGPEAPGDDEGEGDEPRSD